MYQWKTLHYDLCLSFTDGGYLYQINLTLTQIPWKILSDAENFNCMSYIFFYIHEYAEYTSASVGVHSVQTAQYKNAANSAFGFSFVLRCEEIYFKRQTSGSKYR
jgi:hypothetical protein